MHRIKVSLEWSIKNYLKFTLIILFGAFLVLILIIILDKLKIVKKVIDKFLNS